MADCTTFAIIMIVAIVVIYVAVFYFIMEKYNESVRNLANSIRISNNSANQNTDLMSQMAPSDEVRSYGEYTYSAGNRTGKGYIAVTDERLVFKAVSLGDLGTSIASSTGITNLLSKMKEETCNVPIARVSSMSITDEVYDFHNFWGKPSGEVAHVYHLTINAEGILYKLFLAKNKEIGEQFTRTFTSMNRKNQ